MGDAWDYKTRLEAGSEPVLLTGEMIYSWMGEDFAWLRPLKPCAELLAAKGASVAASAAPGGGKASGS